MKIDVTTLDGKKGGSVDLDDAVFGQEPRKDILHRMVRYQLAKRRAGTHQVQERGDVSKTTKRIGKQKGGGTARHGNGSVSQFRGGAKAHGPRMRDHSHDLTKKVRKMALRHALSAKQSAGELIIVDTLALKEAKTATLRKQLEGMGVTNALIVGGSEIDAVFGRAARNIPNVDVLPSQGANVYDILRRHTLVLSKDAVEALQERLK
ncbi:50S ribosomal protein L4 [Algimonas ampicilliniresistens]|jgi:large subunit ribosomal protein L4|uniref:Large ribosomal subunit protein uL4 n=1 Tax=Algimonas ampicilliniresistens TaxID=1298735 RepID=A0ABQ5V6C4_9PROT|nr:50S ribosomal protein L4 [Algimonas ampicilliniresistens]GLQ22131.1 50S ribosomal protein L4 [Algimonas ampicilliniresistens]